MDENSGPNLQVSYENQCLAKEVKEDEVNLCHTA